MSQVIEQQEIPYLAIGTELRAGNVIPFLGAGASLAPRTPLSAAWDRCQTCPPASPEAPPAAAGACDVCPNLTPQEPAPAGACYNRKHCSPAQMQCLPTASELACYLARITPFPTYEKPELTRVAQYYNSSVGRAALYRQLRQIFNFDYEPRPLHYFLADNPEPLLVITTNYDDLIERAYRARNRPYDLVVHTTDPNLGDRILWWPHGAAQPQDVTPNRLAIDLQSTTVIYKMHGAVDRTNPRNDQYVITEDDYIDFLTRMTRNKAIPAIFAEPFQQRHFLFMGYSLSDWNLRVILNHIEKDPRWGRRNKSWAVQQSPSQLERQFWRDRGLNIFDVNIDEFVNRL